VANYRDEKQDTRGTAMLLAELGADLEAKNKQGETIWRRRTNKGRRRFR
jgi:hypothetical protein